MPLGAEPLEAAAVPFAPDGPAPMPPAPLAEGVEAEAANACVAPPPALPLGLQKNSADVMPTAAPTSLRKRTRGSDAFRRRAFFAADSSDDLRDVCVE